MLYQTRAEARRRQPPPDTSTMRTVGPCFLLNEVDVLERFRRALIPKPAKRIKRRERL